MSESYPSIVRVGTGEEGPERSVSTGQVISELDLAVATSVDMVLVARPLP